MMLISFLSFQYTFDCETGSWMHKDFSNLLESRLNSLPQVDVSLRTPDPPKRTSSQSMSLKVVFLILQSFNALITYLKYHINLGLF